MFSGEESYLLLSGIQHFVFCKRQWALIHIEQQWMNNLRTVEGNIFHQRAHDTFFSEKRGDTIISRGLPIISHTLKITGVCDVVEFKRCKHGITLAKYEGEYQVIPVEYKKGTPKITDEDRLQLVAQAICLEEMFCCEITFGYLYYGDTRHRVEVEINPVNRDLVKKYFSEMEDIYTKRSTPKAKQTKQCNACSLKDLCLPRLGKRDTVKTYIANQLAKEE